MSFIIQTFCQFSRWRFVLPTLLFLALALHSGSLIKGGLYADDYIHAAFLLNNEALADKGILKGIGGEGWLNFMQNQFNFFDPESENYQALLDFGILPWWTSDQAKLHFFRPLASLTHYLDYQLYPANTHWMHAINMFWYLLGLSMIFLCYRRFNLPRPVAVLALILVILDVSIFHVINWIASRSMLMLIASGFFCLYAYDRGTQSWRWYLISLFSLLVTLLTAEGAIGICLYLAAYVLVFDSRSWLQRFMSIMPFAMITLLWRVLYIKAGFGTSGLDFYIDPGNNPAGFLERAVWLYPGNYFELFSGIDILSGQLSNSIRQQFAWAGLTVLALSVWLFWQPLKMHKSFCFYFTASIFCLIPSLTIDLSPRTMILPNAAFAVVIAWVFYGLATQVFTGFKKRLAWLFAFSHAILHIFLAGLISLYMTVSQVSSTTMDRGNTGLDFDIQDKHVIFINSERPFWLAFLGVERAYYQQPLPDTVRVLASAFYPISITRINDNTLTLTADPAFQFDAQPVTPQTFTGHYAYLTMHLMGLLRHQTDPWIPGQTRRYRDMSIQVKSLLNGKPRVLTITWDSHHSSDYLWLYWNKTNQKYEPFRVPAVGETRQLQGTF